MNVYTLGATAQEAIDSSVFDKMVIAVQKELYLQWKDTKVTSFKNRWNDFFGFTTDYKNTYGMKILIIERILQGLVKTCVQKKMKIPQTIGGMSTISLSVMEQAGLEKTASNLSMVSDVLSSAVNAQKEIPTAILDPVNMSDRESKSDLEKFWEDNKWTIIGGIALVAAAKAAARGAVTRIL